MKFIRLVANYKGKERVFNFGEKNTLIYSKDNSVGKSTLMRMIFYSLGYPIPSTMAIRFKGLSLCMTFTIKDNVYTVRRRNKELYLSFGNRKYKYILPEEHINFLKIIFNTDNDRVLKNILGAMYVDQDKGWTLLNRGIVIGKIRFNIEELVQGLSGINMKSIGNKIEYLELERKKYLALRAFSSYTKEYSELEDNEPENLDKLQQNIINLTMQKKIYIQKLNDINKSIKENGEFFDILESLKLLVRDEKNNNIPVKKENIVNFDDSFNFLNARKLMIEDKIDILDEKLQIMEMQLNEKVRKLEGINEFEGSMAILRSLFNYVDLSDIDVEDKLNTLGRELNALKKSADYDLYKNSHVLIERIENNIIEYAKKLGVDSILKKQNNFLFTRNLKEISGTQLYMITLCYKLGYIKELEQFLKINLPIVLDSPSGREITKGNTDNIYRLLESEFKNNQLIVASIFKSTVINYDEVIELEKIGKLFDVSDMKNALL